jgi:predicted transport protein
MPLFAIDGKRLRAVSQGKFASEKELQRLIEENLEAVFRCRFVASEFSTGSVHSGRIDTLALSEDDNPVIIEYKNVESSDLINQSLFYLSWIQDHKGDFELAAQKALGKVRVDWSAVRVICLAPNYRRYALHAVRVMGANIELWSYRRFANDVVYLEDVFQREQAALPVTGKNPVTVKAGKKAAATRLNAVYTFDEHLNSKPKPIQDLAIATNDFIAALDSAIEVVPKKQYVAYKTSQNIVCMEVKQSAIGLYLKLNPKVEPVPPKLGRDVTGIGHYGTGDLEIILKTPSDLEVAKPFIQKAYEAVGG